MEALQQSELFISSLFVHKYISPQALIDKLALDQEKEAYVQENNKLKLLLKQYLEGQFKPGFVFPCKHPVTKVPGYMLMVTIV